VHVLVGSASSMSACAQGIWTRERKKKKMPRAISCQEHAVAQPGVPTASYTIDPDGGGANHPYKALCDRTTDGAGLDTGGQSIKAGAFPDMTGDQSRQLVFGNPQSLPFASARPTIAAIQAGGGVESSPTTATASTCADVQGRLEDRLHGRRQPKRLARPA